MTEQAASDRPPVEKSWFCRCLLQISPSSHSLCCAASFYARSLPAFLALFLPWILQLPLAHPLPSFQTWCGTFRTAWWVLPVGVVAKLLFCHPFLSHPSSSRDPVCVTVSRLQRARCAFSDPVDLSLTISLQCTSTRSSLLESSPHFIVLIPGPSLPSARPATHFPSQWVANRTNSSSSSLFEARNSRTPVIATSTRARPAERNFPRVASTA